MKAAANRASQASNLPPGAHDGYLPVGSLDELDAFGSVQVIHPGAGRLRAEAGDEGQARLLVDR